MLGYNNFCIQTSLIVAPIVLSFVYDKNRDMTFYVTAVLSSLSLFTMLYVCTWKNVKEIGKAPLYKQEEEKKRQQQPKDIQMIEITTGEKQEEEKVNEVIAEVTQE